MTRKMAIAEIKRNFSEVVHRIANKGEHFIIKKKGRPIAAMINLEELEMIERLKRKQGNPGLLSAIGAWEDFDNLERVIKEVYKKREKAKERKRGGLD